MKLLTDEKKKRKRKSIYADGRKKEDKQKKGRNKNGRT
jgi:hypothetical protein